MVANYAEDENGATASFGLPDQPFNFEDATSFGQRFIVSVVASQYGPASAGLFRTAPRSKAVLKTGEGDYLLFEDQPFAGCDLCESQR